MPSVELTWKDVVRDALDSLSGESSLDELYDQIEGHEKASSDTWRATVRRTLQQYSIFYQEESGSGLWLLREEEPIQEFDPEEYPHPGHEDVMGMLLELGKLYDYETTVSPYEGREEFLERELGSIATLDEVPPFSYSEVVRTANQVDVMWFEGETGHWTPRYAFEVEHTTGMTKGFARLNDLYNAGIRLNPFVIVPGDRLGKAGKELNRDTFSEIRDLCEIRSYEPLIELYTTAQGHQNAREDFLGTGRSDLG